MDEEKGTFRREQAKITEDMESPFRGSRHTPGGGLGTFPQIERSNRVPTITLSFLGPVAGYYSRHGPERSAPAAPDADRSW